ncbi:hypothetical protein cmbei_2002830 [Cryptosporidium meleagridis]
MNSIPKPRSLRYFKGGVEHIQKSKVFDIIVASEVIEHVNNPGIFVKLISNLIKKDGIVFFTTLNRTVICYIYSIIFGEKIFEMISKGTRSWRKFIKPNELDGFAKKNGLYKLAKTGTIYIPGPIIFIECENMNKLNFLAIYKRNR